MCPWSWIVRAQPWRRPFGLGRKKLSFRHDLLRSVKSVHTFQSPLFFFTRMKLATQWGYLASSMNPLRSSFCTSWFRASYLSGFKERCLYRFDRIEGSIFNQWQVIPSMLSWLQAKMWRFCWRNSIICPQIGGHSLCLTLSPLARSPAQIGTLSSSSIGSPSLIFERGSSGSRLGSKGYTIYTPKECIYFDW